MPRKRLIYFHENVIYVNVKAVEGCCVYICLLSINPCPLTHIALTFPHPFPPLAVTRRFLADFHALRVNWLKGDLEIYSCNPIIINSFTQWQDHKLNHGCKCRAKVSHSSEIVKLIEMHFKPSFEMIS